MKADSPIGWTDQQISEALEVSISSIERVRAAFVEDGLPAALERKAPKREYKRKLDGEQEAHLVALVCSQPPNDRGRWTLTLIAQKMVELEYVDSIAPETIRRTLKKMTLNLG